MQKEKEKILQMRMKQLDKKQQEKMKTRTKKVDSDEDEEPPKDLYFELGLESVKMEEPDMKLPNPHEPLYVLKPVGNYEPPQE